MLDNLIFYLISNVNIPWANLMPISSCPWFQESKQASLFLLIIKLDFHHYGQCFHAVSISVPLQVVAAEGERNASKALQKASMVLSESPAALPLRYLQTLTAVAAQNNSTIVFPLPINVFGSLGKKSTGG